jgi:hypothetical protein
MTKEINPWSGLQAKVAIKKVGLIDKQRNLYALAEEIELSNKHAKPLRPELSKWLVAALKNIACGVDPEVCLNIKPNKPGQNKNQFLKEMQRKYANGFIAASTDKTKSESIKQKEAFQMVARVVGKDSSTVRKDWNAKDTDRSEEYSLSRK